jgi:hypothetical protein
MKSIAIEGSFREKKIVRNLINQKMKNYNSIEKKVEYQYYFRINKNNYLYENQMEQKQHLKKPNENKTQIHSIPKCNK